MSLFAKLDRRQMELLNRPIYPNVPETYDWETLEVTSIVLDSIVSPFASYAINRITGLLDGEERTSFLRKGRAPYNGDDEVEIERTSPKEGVVETVVTERATGKQWRLIFKDEYRVPVVTLETREENGSFRRIARARTNRDAPISGADVPGFLKRDGVDAFIDLSMLLAPKMPTDFRSDWKAGMQRHDREQLPRIRDILANDGGMPGPLSRAYISILHSIVFDGHARWAFSKLDGLVAHLNEQGAVWGEAVLECGNDSACIVPTADGSVALFHDNASTTGDERSYVAKFDRVDGKPSLLSLYPIGQDEETSSAVDAFMEGTATPAFIFNFGDGTQSFNVPGRGQDAMTAFRLWFTSDVEFGIPNGRIVTGFPLFEPEDDDDDIIVATGPAL
ncbi:hypothetical protein [Rhizobium sp. BK176]|uniref:hypothetical protein n=1 Tax=Rhizobium sp. BK176 TaxID=2587071 RepID=UPI00216A294A|nr:hypothetical protein [Rhizobium sp. BK176]MCS4089450.1 hypothetical protein [Rhizobium sp. BK176]